MTLRMVLESYSQPQVRTEATLAKGQLVIGRAEECGWQLSDPQMFISRRHCVIAGQDGVYEVTDESSGGLFLDGATEPLGKGVSATLRPGMRLRLGDFVIRVETGVSPLPSDAPPAPGAMFGDDFFTPRPEAPPPPRPESLPDPFDTQHEPHAEPAADAAPLRPVLFDDPFVLDHAPRPVTPAPDPVPATTAAFDFGDFGLPADLPSAPAPAVVPIAELPPPVVAAADPFGASTLVAQQPPPPRLPVQPGPAVGPLDAAAPALPVSDGEALAALMKGMGIAAPAGFHGTPEEMEALGRRYRAMTEGLVQLLRMRAQEKGSARVAQTVIGAANVNPLKFLAGGDEIIAALVMSRGPGYLDPDAAIAAGIADLLDHHKRSWTGLQAALRRMVDRFDPALFETEVEAVGTLRALVGGGRPARLWQLYSDRYRDIAKAAEDRFLGDVGSDFRKAYETESGRTDDGTA